jgi:uncharacterized protein YecE (DUF72 family)
MGRRGRPDTFIGWRTKTPDDFVMTVKASPGND